MTEGKWGWRGLWQKARERETKSVAQKENIRVSQTKHQKSFRHSWNVKSFTTFQASPIKPPPAPLSSDQTAKALLRHAELDMAPARPSTGSWHLYSQHGKTKHYWNPISCSLGHCSGKGNVWPIFADLEMARTSTGPFTVQTSNVIT